MEPGHFLTGNTTSVTGVRTTTRGLTVHKILLLSHLDCLGLRVNFAKSTLSPSQRVLFLGTVIDSMQMTTTVSAEQATTIQRHTASLKEGAVRSKRMLGLMAVASPVLQLGLLHMRPIQFWLSAHPPSHWMLYGVGCACSGGVMSDFVSLCLVFPCPYLVFLSSLVH